MRRLDPRRFHAERRIARGEAVQRPNTRPGLIASSRSGCTTLSPMATRREPDAIGVGPELEVVADVHGLHEEAELLRELAADAADARQQSPPFVRSTSGTRR
jgi:hypothetical protein